MKEKDSFHSTKRKKQGKIIILLLALIALVFNDISLSGKSLFKCVMMLG